MIKREYFVSYILHSGGITNYGSLNLTTASWLPMSAKELVAHAERQAAKRANKIDSATILSISKLRVFL